MSLRSYSALDRCEHPGGVVTYQSPLLRGLGVRHAFSTRLGGVSEGPYASLNLGYLTKGAAPDDNTSVAENFRRLRRAIGTERIMRIQARQVHGAGVWVPPARPVKLGDSPEADAMVTDHPLHMLTIRVADCAPILLAAEGGRIVGAIHAGWRGVVSGVVGETIEVLADRFGVRPGDLVAAVGPCIGVDAFEVGPEVVEAFEEAGLGEAVRPADGGGGKPHVDLAGAVVGQLLAAGVPSDAVECSDRCTYRDEAEFFSHRRDSGVTGRMAALICPVGDGGA